jgi:hypothetical protein
MKRVKTKQWLVMAVVMVNGLLAAGCTSYFKVTDPTSGSVYYTEKVKQSSSGAVTFKDARTRADVTIQISEIKEISEKEYDIGRTSQVQKAAPAAPAPAAPAPAPAPAPTPESAPAPEGGS